jgi:hypothetical protein
MAGEPRHVKRRAGNARHSAAQTHQNFFVPPAGYVIAFQKGDIFPKTFITLNSL